MNKRRWIAILIAAVLVIFSGIATLIRSNEDTETLTGLNGLLYGNNQVGEQVIVDGDANQRIAWLHVDGTIANTGGGGLFSAEGYDHQLFLEELKQIQSDESIAAVILEVNSPGGGVYESAEIAKELRKIQKLNVPIYVSMTGMAASGGYYISASADKIFATQETVTGSIGVIMSGMNYAGLLDKLGIEDMTYKSGALKDIGSTTRKPTEADRQVMQAFVDSAYGRFVKVVADGRHMSEANVRKLADGRIYDGTQAVQNGLVDALGYPEDVLSALQKDYDLEDAQVIEYTPNSTGFINTWLGSQLAELQGLKASDSTRMLNLMESIGTPDSPKAMYYYGGE